MSIAIYFKSPVNHEFTGWVGDLYKIIPYRENGVLLGIQIQVIEPLFGRVSLPRNTLGLLIARFKDLIKTYPKGVDLDSEKPQPYIPIECIQHPFFHDLELRFDREEEFRCLFTCDIHGIPHNTTEDEQYGDALISAQVTNEWLQLELVGFQKQVISVAKQWGQPFEEQLTKMFERDKKLRELENMSNRFDGCGSGYGYSGKSGQRTLDGGLEERAPPIELEGDKKFRNNIPVVGKYL
jgi:hypothetical protein